MDWITRKILRGGTITTSSATKRKGIKTLLTDGFHVCVNKSYYEKDDIIVHWNSVMKKWTKSES